MKHWKHESFSNILENDGSLYICSVIYSVIYRGLIRKQKLMCVLALQHLLMCNHPLLSFIVIPPPYP